MIQFRSLILIFLTVTLLFTRCDGNENNRSNESHPDMTSNELEKSSGKDSIESMEEEVISLEEPSLYQIDTSESWKDLNRMYQYFGASDLDTVRIGPKRTITNIEDYFSEERNNVCVIVDEGEYIYDSGIWINGENIILKAEGRVSLFCNVLYDNVMWISGSNIVVDNFHMMHLLPGDPESQNCSGRVIGLDNASNVTITNCDLNGCGLAGIHDNLGNSDIYVEYNYIHNNSLGAFTDIDGGVWQEEINNHPTFRFENNKIANNGFNRLKESSPYGEDEYDEYPYDEHEYDEQEYEEGEFN